MDLRDISMARSYAKDIIIALIDQGCYENLQQLELLNNDWNALTDATLRYYCDKLRAMKKAE